MHAVHGLVERRSYEASPLDFHHPWKSCEILKGIEANSRSAIAVDDVYEVLHTRVSFYLFGRGWIRDFDEDLNISILSQLVRVVGRCRTRAASVVVQPVYATRPVLI